MCTIEHTENVRKILAILFSSLSIVVVLGLAFFGEIRFKLKDLTVRVMSIEVLQLKITDFFPY
jgi:hypothetical protein